MPKDADTEAAKARLRNLGEELGFASWVEQHPLGAALLAMGAGGVAGRLPPNKLLMLLDVLVQLLPSEESSASSQ